MPVQTSPTVDHGPVARSEGSGSIEPTNRPAPRKKGSGIVKWLVILVVVGGGLGGAYAYLGKEKSLAVVEFLREQVGLGREVVPTPDAVTDKPKGPWNGLVRVSEDERKAVGFRIINVQPQTEPIRLQINGKTDYDLNTLNKLRPRFDNALVEKVFVQAGQLVKKGDPLLELRSAELGLAKNECRTSFVQWDHDHKLRDAREPLAKEGRITLIIWTDTQNDEKKSRLTYLVSRDKLETYGLTVEQIDKLLESLLDDKTKVQAAVADPSDITRITVLSPIDGIVVDRDAVPGNFYDQVNIMLTISPMTDLWVWGNVFESDQEKVHRGQKWDIEFQFTHEKFQAIVESIANGVDADTRTLRIRATIDNRGKELKAGMLVTAAVQIPPREGDTVIPRNALSVINGEYYAFIQKGTSGEDVDLFERRKLEIDQENTDAVVVRKGLKAGERVVSNGSLILSQMFEDQSTVDSGLPVQ